jgi:hypothetical protein
VFSCYLSIPAVIFKTEMAEGGKNPLLAGLNPNAAPYDMDSLIAAADGLQRNCRLPDFVIEKPEAWFKCMEAQLEDAKVVKSKEKYNKVLGKLPVHIIKELAPVTDNPSAFEVVAVVDCIWEMRGGNPAALPPLGNSSHQLNSSSSIVAATAVATTAATVAAMAATTTALEGATVAAPLLQGELCETMAALGPMVAAVAVAASMAAATWGQASVSTTTAMAAQLPDASHPASSLRETARPVAAT